MSGSQRKYVLDWPIVPSTWLVKIGINLSWKKMLALEDSGPNWSKGTHFCLVVGSQQLEHSPFLNCIFVCHQTIRLIQPPCFQQKCIGIQQHQQQITQTNGRVPDLWKATMSLNSLPWFKVIINIISKVDTSYRAKIGYFLQCTYLDFIKTSFVTFGKERKMGVPQTPLLCVQISKQGLPQWQVYPHYNIYLQQGHATTWVCWYRWTRVVMLV